MICKSLSEHRSRLRCKRSGARSLCSPPFNGRSAAILLSLMVFHCFGAFRKPLPNCRSRSPRASGKVSHAANSQAKPSVLTAISNPARPRARVESFEPEPTRSTKRTRCGRESCTINASPVSPSGMAQHVSLVSPSSPLRRMLAPSNARPTASACVRAHTSAHGNGAAAVLLLAVCGTAG